MCQGFNGKNSGDSGQNALKSYKDFANQAVSSPLAKSWIIYKTTKT